MVKKPTKRFLIAALTLAAAVLVYVLYLWFMPHRDVQSARAYARLSVSSLVTEFSKDPNGANARYLSADGNSKVLIVSGRVQSISRNQQQETLLVLGEPGIPAGVNCSFTKEGSLRLGNVKVGDSLSVKGAISAGNHYDPDLDLQENAVMVQCDIAQ